MPKFSGSVSGRLSRLSLLSKCRPPLRQREERFSVLSSPSSNTVQCVCVYVCVCVCVRVCVCEMV